jgi:uncharacterized protein YjbJ (UPF0337 family)
MSAFGSKADIDRRQSDVSFDPKRTWNFSTFGRVHLLTLVFPGRVDMDEDRIAGTARKLGGKVQEDVGRFTGDTQTQIKGMANQAAGTAQDLYGQAADAARDTAERSTSGSATPSKHSHMRPL